MAFNDAKSLAVLQGAPPFISFACRTAEQLAEAEAHAVGKM